VGGIEAQKQTTELSCSLLL